MDAAVLQSLRSISIYESRLHILISGQCLTTKRYHIIEIQRPIGSDARLQMTLHSRPYTMVEKDNLTASFKCVSIISDAFCIFGFISLVESSYIVVVLKASLVGVLHGHNIYTIVETTLVPVTYKVRNTMEESRYKSILLSFNLANNEFYFSYSYNLAQSMQLNCSSMNHSEDNMNVDKYVWNYHALKIFLSYHICHDQNASDIPVIGSALAKKTDIDRWIVPVIHGFFKQKIIGLVSDHTLRYTLLARRSWIFAGTRYLRRGVDSDGYTANEVETEQIVTKEETINVTYRSSSLIQVRGSIPLYWYHTNLFVPSPDIKIDSIDYGYDAAFKHFGMLKCAYGDNVTVLNLVRLQNSNREITVGGAFEELVTALNSHSDKSSENDNETTDSLSLLNKKTNNINRNQKKNKLNKNDNKIEYVAYDFHGSPHGTLFNDLGRICASIAPYSGFFVQAPHIYKDNIESVNDTNVLYTSWPIHRFENSTADAYLDRSLHDLFILDSGSNGSSDENVCRDINYKRETLLEKIPDNVPNFAGNSSELKEESEKMNIKENPGKGISTGLLQMGVLRTNCIDCLDRTNVAQFCYARYCLYFQIKALGMDFSFHSMQDLDGICSEFWSQHGDVIAHQYGGSGAMHSLTTSSSSSSSMMKMVQSISSSSSSIFSSSQSQAPTQCGNNFDPKKSISTSATSTTSTATSNSSTTASINQIKFSDFLPTWGMKSNSQQQEGGEREFVLSGGAKNALVAVQRYYSNVATDFERQQSMDLLLGFYIPCRGSLPIWDSDMYAPTVSRGNVNKERSSVLSEESSLADGNGNSSNNSDMKKSVSDNGTDKNDDVQSDSSDVNVDGDNDVHYDNSHNDQENNNNSSDNVDNNKSDIVGSSYCYIENEDENEEKNNIKSNRMFTIKPTDQQHYQRKKGIILPFRDIHLPPSEERISVSSSQHTSSLSTISKRSTETSEALRNDYVLFDNIEYQPYPKRSSTKNENSLKCKFNDRNHVDIDGKDIAVERNDRSAISEKDEVSAIRMTDDEWQKKDIAVGNNDVNNAINFSRNLHHGNNNDNDNSNSKNDNFTDNDNKNKNDNGYENNSLNITEITDGENKTNEGDIESDENEISCDKSKNRVQESNEDKKIVASSKILLDDYKNVVKNGCQNENENVKENGNIDGGIFDNLVSVRDPVPSSDVDVGQKASPLGSLYQWMFMKTQDQTSDSIAIESSSLSSK